MGLYFRSPGRPGKASLNLKNTIAVFSTLGLILVWLAWSNLTITENEQAQAPDAGYADSEVIAGSKGLNGVTGLDRAQVQMKRKPGRPDHDSPAKFVSLEDHSARATITVRRVRSGDVGDGISAVRISYVSRGGRKEDSIFLGETDSVGRLDTILPHPGRFELIVDPDSIPNDLRAGRYYQTAGSPRPGISQPRFEIGAGEHKELTVWLDEFRTLWGRVVGPNGSGVPYAVVEAGSTVPGLESVSHRATTDEKGVFEFNDVLPVPYSLRIDQLASMTPDLEGCVYPPPSVVDLTNASKNGVEIRIERGEIQVSGIVVDEEGHPFANLDVLAYYAAPAQVEASETTPRFRYTMGDRIGSTTTDEGGRYQFNGLLRHNFCVQLGAKGAANGGREKRTLAQGIDVIRIDPTNSKVVDWQLDPVVALRSHTYEFSGHVFLSREQPIDRPFDLSDLELEASFPVPREQTLKGWGVQARPFVTFDKGSGYFSVSCDTPREEILLRIYPRGSKHLAKELTLYPQADVIEENSEVRFP